MNRPLIDEHGEVRELTQADFAKFKPASDVLPSDFLNMVKTRGKQKEPTKTATTLRLDPVILEFFKKDGKGYQTRINQVLLEYVLAHR
ncbi:BrnA antitoxin family protein [Moraxella nasibovis]|uniref:BrnA antitoxin family protein n=1 Tax=Moraxella nasibovis TaxID=2904120 RepID=UPI00240EB1FE|nr:BrnA antitoxin family protein [Moraxella nasibovis]WFF39304.1 BrnA antitoxin family protein [Moraxella nasibovis]